MGDSSFRRHGLHTRPFARRAKVPWKECNPMDERLKFIARLLNGEAMAGLCREFGISRKTGYKILTDTTLSAWIAVAGGRLRDGEQMTGNRPKCNLCARNGPLSSGRSAEICGTLGVRARGGVTGIVAGR